MKIAEVKFHKVIVPMKPDTVHSPGVDDKLCAPDAYSGRALNFYEFPKWIIEVIADDGTVGLGEPRRGDIYWPLKKMADRIIGMSLEELTVGNLPLLPDPQTTYDAIYEAYEMAWLDLLGKHLGVPVWHLLGGKVIDRVPVDYWMGRATPEDTHRRAARAAAMGFHGVKMKCKLGDPIAERVAAVRAAAPDFMIMFDPNERFMNPAGTIEVSKSLEKYDRVAFESPVPQNRLDWYVMLRKKIPQPLALHMSSIDSVLQALRMDAADYYNLMGPLKYFATWATVTRAAGCPTWRSTGMDLGVYDMASVHCAAVAGCELPCDTIGNMFRECDLLKESIPFEDGYLVVPDKPGLGVELDMDAVDKYRVPIEEEQQ